MLEYECEYGALMLVFSRKVNLDFKENEYTLRGINSTAFVSFLIWGLHCNFNPIALRKAKIVYNFGLTECSRVKGKKLLIGKQDLSCL